MKKVAFFMLTMSLSSLFVQSSSADSFRFVPSTKSLRPSLSLTAPIRPTHECCPAGKSCFWMCGSFDAFGGVSACFKMACPENYSSGDILNDCESTGEMRPSVPSQGNC